MLELAVEGGRRADRGTRGLSVRLAVLCLDLGDGCTGVYIYQVL